MRIRVTRRYTIDSRKPRKARSTDPSVARSAARARGAHEGIYLYRRDTLVGPPSGAVQWSAHCFRGIRAMTARITLFRLQSSITTPSLTSRASLAHRDDGSVSSGGFEGSSAPRDMRSPSSLTMTHIRYRVTGEDQRRTAPLRYRTPPESARAA